MVMPCSPNENFYRSIRPAPAGLFYFYTSNIGPSFGKKANLCLPCMQTLHPYSIFHLGDSALTIDFGNGIEEALNKKVLQLFYYLQQTGNPFIKDLVPAYSSLTVYYDVCALKKENREQTAFDTMSDMINAIAFDFENTQITQTRLIHLPVCYAGKFAPDLEVFENHNGVSAEELIAIHTSKVYRVFMLGFLPGFAYMGEVDPRIAVPRKERPRLEVEKGSVGIAGLQTGIYPLNSPGGWQIFGRTPIVLFDKQADNPVLFRPGDTVQFYSISEDEFENYQNGHT